MGEIQTRRQRNQVRMKGERETETETEKEQERERLAVRQGARPRGATGKHRILRKTEGMLAGPLGLREEGLGARAPGSWEAIFSLSLTSPLPVCSPRPHREHLLPCDGE